MTQAILGDPRLGTEGNANTNNGSHSENNSDSETMDHHGCCEGHLRGIFIPGDEGLDHRNVQPDGDNYVMTVECP